MTYYILLDGDSVADTLYDTNTLGSVNSKTFYPERGFDALQNILNQQPDLVSTIRILDTSGKPYTVEQFVDMISKLHIMKH